MTYFNVNLVEVPSSPRSLHTAKVTTSAVTLEWSVPESDGGTPVLSYHIYIKHPDQDDFQPVGQVDGDILSYTCTKLRQDTDYDFQVKAENEAGLCAKPARLKKLARTKAKASKLGLGLIFFSYWNLCTFLSLKLSIKK